MHSPNPNAAGTSSVISSIVNALGPGSIAPSAALPAAPAGITESTGFNLWNLLLQYAESGGLIRRTSRPSLQRPQHGANHVARLAILARLHPLRDADV
jgi:hypothetical protein